MSKKYHYDKKSDSFYICIKEGEEERFEEVAPGINIEFDKNDKIIGVEVLKASRFLENLPKAVSIKH